MFGKKLQVTYSFEILTIATQTEKVLRNLKMKYGNLFALFNLTFQFYFY